MMSWLLSVSYLKSSKIKGELPDVVHKYISNYAHIGFEYDFTLNRKEAFVFDDEAYTEAEVKGLADTLGLVITKLN